MPRILIGLALQEPNPWRTSIFSPVGTSARSIFGVSMLFLGVTGAIFVIVAGLLLYAVIKYRHRPDDPKASQEPRQIYGSTQIELSWTLIPVLIVVMLFLATTRVILATQNAPKPANALDVTTIGHQFWWEFTYPKYGVRTANELHIPVSDPKNPTPTYLTLSSADVNHEFWVPRLAGKTDLIPNRINTMWIETDKPGFYPGQCSQYCGTQHALMLLRVYVDTPEQFDAWIAHQKQPAVNDPRFAEGRNIFEHTACISCHTISGTVANGRFGPDLTHVGSRDTIASGAVKNTPENLRAFVGDPAHFKPGVLMPSMHLNDHDLDAITAYLESLK